MNSTSFNSISELNEYKKNLKISSEVSLLQYLNTIHSNLLQREPIVFERSLHKRKLTNDLSNSQTLKKSNTQNKAIFQKLNSDNGISLKTFTEYMNLQEFITERLFKYFNKSKTNLLNKTEFVNGLQNLYYSDTNELIKLTFFLADFNEDSKIYKPDMSLFLAYIPSSSDILQKIKLKQITKIINTFFDEKIKSPTNGEEKEIDLDLYTQYINEYNEKSKSDSNIDGDLVNDFDNNAPFFYFISILSYLFLNCPVSIKNINYFAPKNKKVKFILKKSESNQTNLKNFLLTTIKKKDTVENKKENMGLSTNFVEKNRFKIDAIPKIGRKNLFHHKRSASQKIILQNRNYIKEQRSTIIKKENIKEKDFIVAIEKDNIKQKLIKKEINTFKKKFKSTQSQCFSPFQRNAMNEFYRSPQIGSVILKDSQKEESNSNNNNKLRFSLKTKLPAINKEKMTPLSVGFNYKKDEKDFKEPSEFVLCDQEEGEEFEEKTNDSNSIYCFKAEEINNNNTLNPKIINKFYAVLSGKEILFFHDNKKAEIVDIWYVFKSHINIGKETINNTKYFSININYFNNDNINKIYFLKENECQNFAKKIKQTIHDLSFDDFYELGEQLGQGHFGKVCKCKNKNSNKLYAVKIINKPDLQPSDLELIHRERSYLNLIKHPNIIGLKDYFEDKKSMYLVTELCSAGDLITFIENNNKISEKTAAKIIRKIAEGIKYLNIFGIIHRDIKPENILFSEENDIKSLKIIDLGVCKTLTYGQMANEPIGTNGYISPEIYLHKEYSFKIDIWSLGVILYLLITQGMLPFDHEDMDNKVIGKKVIYLQQEYPEEYFGKCNKSLMNLLDKMLDKNYDKRIDINNVLKDSWFNIIKKQA